jgi:hypothetical protein
LTVNADAEQEPATGTPSPAEEQQAREAGPSRFLRTLTQRTTAA